MTLLWCQEAMSLDQEVHIHLRSGVAQWLECRLFDDNILGLKSPYRF